MGHEHERQLPINGHFCRFLLLRSFPDHPCTQNNNATMVTINAGNTPSPRTRRNRLALILSLFCFLSFYTIDESEFLSFLSSNESPSDNRRQLISDNVWEAELQARQLRLTGSNLNKKQRVQIERKRMLEEDVASGEPSDNIWSSKGRGPPTSRYVSFGNCSSSPYTLYAY